MTRNVTCYCVEAIRKPYEGNGIMKKILTIVVPAYNAEKYLEQCLESFIDINILNSLEIIIVNDGSSDKTEEIAKKYCNKYPSSFQMHTKENGGHGSAINYAIKKATGKYFRVVDADDWVETTLLMDFVKKLEHINSDIVAGDYCTIDIKNNNKTKQKHVCRNAFHYGKEWGFAEAETEGCVSIHALTYKTSVLQENSIMIDENIAYDNREFEIYPIPYCSSVFFDPNPLYNFRIGRRNQTINARVMQRNREEHLHVIEELLSYISTKAVESTFKYKYMKKGIVDMIKIQYGIYLSMESDDGMEEFMKFDQMLQNEYPGIYEDIKDGMIKVIRKSKYRMYHICAKISNKLK